MIRFLIGLFLEGLIFVAVVRAILPGEQNWTIGQTIAIGVISWVALGILFRVVLGVVAGLVLPLLLLGGAALYLSRRRGGALPR
ncbi:MAG TPA: GlsB/YeaQ/YmgE family stress response membrane protein [Acidimicrobiia bacterium]|nr:GlsB/YeaQ/YmgE family stress response membrane protein [Acidimicrobiia bacterium]